MTGYNGLGASLGTLAELSHARSRSISPENFSGEKGAGSLATEGTGAREARELGVGWKKAHQLGTSLPPNQLCS
jgi:hypothetical protein